MNKNNIKNITKNSAVMSIAVFFSRILGLVRDQVMAAFFGTSFINDAFNIAFYIPNLLRQLFGEGALSAAFVPIYNEFGLKRGKNYQFIFALNVLSILSFFLLVLSLLGVIFAPLIVRIIYPGLSVETSELAIKLCRLMFPYMFFIGLSSTFIAILNSHNKFFITGLSSGLLNIGWIIFVLFGAYVLKKETSDLVYFAAYGVMLGGFLQTIINLPILKKVGYHFKIILRVKTTAMKMLWKRFLPGVIGVGVREIYLITDALIASFLPIGSITALGFGSRLMQLPLGIFGISVGTAVLPEYSRQFTEKRWTDISETLSYSLHFILYFLAPITVIMIMGSDVFIRLLFQRGLFDETAVQMTKLALIYYTIGLSFLGLNQVITPLFYAVKDTKTPVKIAACMLFLNITLKIILMQFMDHAGIALGTSITAFVQFFVILILLKKKLPEIKLLVPLKNILKLFIILAVLVAIIWISKIFLFNIFSSIEQTSGFINNLFYAVSLLTIAFVTVIIGFHFLKPVYYQEVASRLIARLRRKNNL
ncbi:MAG: murein biosynthesis integral membrane protein MurJ [Candidatus Cloacimonetes bacterium]|nr:murein biosynthesis integral membrane protein MurJ [Candidatus Cloacimonadota bacterium]